MAKRHVMTAKRRSALRKAQLVSARKRRGSGKSKASVRKYRKISAQRKGRTIKALKYGAIGAAVVGGAVAGHHLYKHRERLIVAPMAEHQTVLFARMGGVKGKYALARVRLKERHEHAHRSTFRAREYQQGRQYYQRATRMGLNIRPGHSLSYTMMSGMDPHMQQYIHGSYVKGRKTRAEHRLRRMKGKKAVGFTQKSGQVKMVFGRKVVRLPF